MRERCTLGEAGRAGGVLNVDRLVELDDSETFPQPLVRNVFCGRKDVRVAQRMFQRRLQLVVAEEHDRPQVGQSVANLAHDLHVFARLVAHLRQEHGDFALA